MSPPFSGKTKWNTRWGWTVCSGKMTGARLIKNDISRASDTFCAAQYEWHADSWASFNIHVSWRGLKRKPGYTGFRREEKWRHPVFKTCVIPGIYSLTLEEGGVIATSFLETLNCISCLEERKPLNLGGCKLTPKLLW